ncbi:MAG TPA: hypothetical protein VH599_14215 [Ktedonobacterales bacterium]|jgi:hypothetical protein
MDIRFIQSQHHRIATVVTRKDGVRLSVPVYGPLDPIPHDLAHYVLELELGLEDGFWGSVAAGALFEGIHILAGRQGPHATDRSRAVLAAHRQGIGISEVLVGWIMDVVKGTSLGNEPLPIASPLVRTRADQAALLARLRPAIEAMCTRWGAVPPGGTLLVVWPDRPARLERASHRRAARQH